MKIDLQATKSALDNAVANTFADMAFVDVVPTEKPEVEQSFSQVLYIEILGPVRGHLIFYLPLACKQSLVENIHGKDWDELHSDEIDDCLLEILNVLAGNFLNNYLGKGVKFNISFPTVLFDDSELPDKESLDFFYYDAEGELFKMGVGVQ